MMKYLGSVLMLGLSLVWIQPTFAAPQDYIPNHAQHDEIPSHEGKRFKSKEDYREQRKQDGEHRRQREKNHWKAGSTLPREYRYTDYQVDYTQHSKLSPPTQYQQWIKINNQYMLMNVLTNTIIKVIPE